MVKERNKFIKKNHESYTFKDLTNTYYWLNEKHSNIRYSHFIIVPNNLIKNKKLKTFRHDETISPIKF